MKELKKLWNMPFRFEIRSPIITTKDNLRALKNNIQSFFMRGIYGVSAMDCWDLDNYMLSTFRNGLITFKKDDNGYPGKDEADTPEKWDKIIDRMIELCDIILVDPIDDPAAEKLFNKFFNQNGTLDRTTKYEKEWMNAVEMASEKREEAKKELSTLLLKWFDNLWW